MNELLTKGIGHTEFKDSPVGWCRSTIGEVSFVTKLAGFEYTKYFDYSVGGEIIAIRVLNLKGGKLDLSDVQTIPKSVSDGLLRSKLSKGDNVISYVGTVGEVAYIHEDNKFHLAPNVAKISPDRTKIDGCFLTQVLTSEKTQESIKLYASTTSQPSLNMGNLRKVFLPIPPLPEQQKIASILTSVDEVIEKTQSQINKLQDLKKGTMNELLTKGIGHTEFKDSPVGKIPKGWEVSTVGQLINFTGGSQPPRSTFVFTAKDGYVRLLQIRDYKTDKFATYIPEELSRRYCSEDDVMIGRYGPPIFQILRGKSGSYNVALIKSEPDSENLLNSYMYHFLTRDDLFHMIDSLSQRTSGQTGIDFEALKSFCFFLPPVEEQKRIVKILDHFDFYIEEKQRKLEQTQSLKKSLMQDLLTGKVRVTVN